MAVRPLSGLVSIAEYPDRFRADTAVALLAAAGIDAVVLGDPAAAVAPHLVTARGFSVLVRIGIADDANQVLVHAGRAPVEAPSTMPAPARFGPPPSADPPGTDHGDADDVDADRPSGRPRWVKVVAWVTAGSVLLPLLAGAASTVSQL